MKSKIVSLVLLTALISLSFVAKNWESRKNETSKLLMNTHTDSLLRHVVLFKFKEGTAAADIAKVEEAFSSLPSKIPEIVGYEWGLNNSPEDLEKGFTHCFFLTFNSEEDRATYLPHPDHKAFGAVLGPHLDDVLVLDYWAK